MRKQPFLLIFLALIMIGNPLVVGMTTGPDNNVSASLDALCNDLVNIAFRAHQYYRRPAALGGGGNSFVGLTADAAGLAKLIKAPGGRTANGCYTIVLAGRANQVELQGVATVTVSGGHYVTMQILVRDGGRPDSLYRVY